MPPVFHSTLCVPVDRGRQLSRPNILFILTDQWRGDCVGVTGHPVVETPNLDSVARGGVVFTSAYSSCPSCVAARASIFTGLSPSSTGRIGYQDRVPWQYPEMLPQVLGDSGYQTHCVGKTHFFPQRFRGGFHSLESYEGEQNHDGTYVNDYFEWLREKTNGLIQERDSGISHNGWVSRPSHLPEELHNNTWVATRCIEYLRRLDPTRPFFLNASFHRPHPPIDPPRVYWDMYRDLELPPVPVGDWAGIHDVEIDSTDPWHGRLPQPQLDRARRGYFAQISHIDNQVGRILHFLNRARVGPTVIVFSADHGEMLGDHHMFRKTYAYEGSARVPLILRIPDQEPSEMVCPTPAVLEDIYPTILELAGVAVPDRIEGRSLVPVYSGEGLRDRDFVHGEHSACYDPENAMQFLTDGKEKYIWSPPSGKEQFFDLSRDPDELVDLAGRPEERARLELWRRRMVEHLAPRKQDGLSDGEKLISGVSLPATREGALG